VAERVADQGQRVMTGQRPYVLVDLPNGDRFTAIKPPLSIHGTAINIRHFQRTALTLADLAQRGTFESERSAAPDPAPTLARTDAGDLPPIARFLAQITARNLASILISGEFGAGKTTLLSALSRYVPPRVQVAVVESFAELKIAHPHPLRVVVPERDQRGDRDAPTMDEVLNVVVTRMRPDLLIIGEIVRDEAARFLDAINLGKRAWATIHGNDCLGALYRLETKALTLGLPHQAIREQIAAGVNVIVHLRRDAASGRRYVAQVARVKPHLIDGRYDLDLLWDAAGAAGDELEALIAETISAGGMA
jgi:pilus assembly protein CpaF